jgi:hypothetical protein
MNSTRRHFLKAGVGGVAALFGVHKVQAKESHSNCVYYTTSRGQPEIACLPRQLTLEEVLRNKEWLKNHYIMTPTGLVDLHRVGEIFDQ